MRSGEVPKIFNGFLGNIYGEVVVIEGGLMQPVACYLGPQIQLLYPISGIENSKNKPTSARSSNRYYCAMLDECEIKKVSDAAMFRKFSDFPH